MRRWARFVGWALLFSLSGCGTREVLAPVVELQWRATNTHASEHIVARGETLYAIAFRYEKDYRQLAVLNHLPPPYTLRVGQRVRLQSASFLRRPSPPLSYTRSTPQPVVKSIWHALPLRQGAGAWVWPVQGKVVAYYRPDQGKKGIDIAARQGEQIHAAHSGVVAYAGNGLAGYGNLIIIKHDNHYLTAYGNNQKNLVREGQSIRAGQAIAIIGVVDRRYWGVHFEIRRAGQPVDPMRYLQRGR